MYHFLIFIVILIYIYETIKHITNVNKELLYKNNSTSSTQSEQNDSKEKFTSEVTLKYGFDRLVFGTDFPYSFGEIELLKLKFSNLPENIVEKILYKNAQKIYVLMIYDH